MTVCIAVRCPADNSFICACDRMLSSDYNSYEPAAIKKWPIGTRWQMMFAALDVSVVLPIYRRIVKYCADTTFSIEDVAGAFERSYREARELMADAYLSRFKMNLGTFMRDGAQRFGPSMYLEVIRRVEAISVGAEFLVFGFDADQMNHIFTINDEARAQSLDIEGFGTIGTGGWIANASLISRPLPLASPDELLYRVCEAKFSSESAPTVGRSTVLSHFQGSAEPNGIAKDVFILTEDIEAIRRIWNRRQTMALPFKSIIRLRGAMDRAMAPLQIMRLIEKARDKQ